MKKLFQAYAEDDDTKFMEIAMEIISNEERKKHNLLANELKKLLFSNKQKNFKNNTVSRHFKTNIPIPRDTEKGFPLLEIKENYFHFNDVILTDDTKEKLENVVEEFRSAEILYSYGLKPKQKILFCGPPGTGKTLSSKVVCSELGYPLVYIRFDSIISSYLGQTATNLRKIFTFIEHGEWVVLFDEFDIIGKRRDDPYEHGEIKRVVNNFMQMLDNFEGKSLIICATNHQHLLDSAIWRRFDDIIYFDMPDSKRRIMLFEKYLRVLKRSGNLNINNLANLTENFSPADIAQLCEESFRRVIIHGKNEITNDDILWAINKQRNKKKIREMKENDKI
ncbi:MAG: AAA family ATPase [Candidatus Helarchaeota archaeon]